MELSNLPNEIIADIIDLLQPEQLSTVCRVSKLIYSLCYDSAKSRIYKNIGCRDNVFTHKVNYITLITKYPYFEYWDVKYYCEDTICYHVYSDVTWFDHKDIAYTYNNLLYEIIKYDRVDLYHYILSLNILDTREKEYYLNYGHIMFTAIQNKSLQFYKMAKSNIKYLRHSCLEYAARWGIINIFKYILDKRDNDCYLESAFDAAVSNGYYKIAVLLIEEGVSISCITSETMYKIIKNNDINMLKLIIEDNKSKIDVCHLNMSTHDIDMFKLLFKNIVTFKQPNNHAIVLASACSKGNIEMVKMLLEHGCNINYDMEFPALSRCVKKGYRDITDLLFEKGIIVTDRNIMLIMRDAAVDDIRYFYKKCLEYGYHDMVLLTSVQYNHIDNIDRLKELDYDFGNDVTKKAIMNSITGRRIDFVSKMIEYGCAVNDDMLIEACARGFSGIVKLLLDNNCNKYNWEAMMYAKNNGYDEIVKMMG